MDLPFSSISHDLDVAKYICDQETAKYVGKLAEILDVRSVSIHPRRPLRKRCSLVFSSLTHPDRSGTRAWCLEVDVAGPVNQPSGWNSQWLC